MHGIYFDKEKFQKQEGCQRTLLSFMEKQAWVAGMGGGHWRRRLACALACHAQAVGEVGEAVPSAAAEHGGYRL